LHHLLAIFRRRTFGEPIGDLDEVDFSPRGGKRCHPAALAAFLQTDPGESGTREPSRFGERSDGIVGEGIEVLSVFRAGFARATFVVHEDADPAAGKRCCAW